MKISELLAWEIDPAKIKSPHVRNEVTTLLDLARVGLGLEVRAEWRDELRRNNIVERKPLVHNIVFLNIPEANAFAFTTSGRPSIAITVGVPLITRGLFVAALAEPDVLNDMRDVHYLRVPYKALTQCDWVTLADLLHAFSFEKFYAWAESAPRLPQTEDHSGRGDLAIILSMQAWMFIVFHELGHHMMQHVGAPGVEPPGVAYTEVEAREPDSIALAKSSDRMILGSGAAAQLSEVLLLRHANELEADRYAIAKMYQGFFRSHGAVAISSANYMAMTTMSERSRARLWLVTIGIVFLLFEVAGRSRVANTHPRPLFRLQHLLEFTRTQADTVVPHGSKTEFGRGFEDAIRDLRVVAQKLGISDPYPFQPDDAIYKDRMMEIRASRPRVFKDDGSE